MKCYAGQLAINYKIMIGKQATENGQKKSIWKIVSDITFCKEINLRKSNVECVFIISMMIMFV